MNLSLPQALKYQTRERLSVAQIHPSLRFTRLGAVLREHATAPDEVGALAHSALTGDHSQPLELMPLHLLKDRMQEEPDHPLAKEFNWERVPEGVKLDNAFRSLLGENLTEHPNQTMLRLESEGSLDPVLEQHPYGKEISEEKLPQYRHSLDRLSLQRHFQRNFADDPEGAMQALVGSPTTFIRPSERY